MTEIATLGGGCFWCLEAVFEPLAGVSKVESGFAGGHVPGASYREVCDGTTGHAEVVQITFDPEVIPYLALLELFFAFHDPTTLNRQGPDVGTQYRSVVFTHSPEQAATAKSLIAQLDQAAIWGAPIVTEVVPFEALIPAGASHQAYYRNNSQQPYCQAMIAPKVAKLRQKYAARLKAGSV